MAIDRIDNNGYITPGSSDNKRVQNSDVRDNSESFTLLKDEAGVIYEPGESGGSRPRTLSEVRAEIASEERAAALENIHSRFDGPGVTVELSEDSVQASAGKKDETLFDIVKSVLASVREFFLNLWNGGGETETPASGSAQTIPEDGAAESAAERNGTPVSTAIKDAAPESSATRNGTTADKDPRIRSNTPEDIAAFMLNYGGGKLAKNSDLLTQYNRQGNIVNLDPMVKKRILRGEGRIRRY